MKPESANHLGILCFRANTEYYH